MSISDLIRQASRELYLVVCNYFGKTVDMTDREWVEVVGEVNRVCAKYENTAAKEYAIQYGLCLLYELDRQAREAQKIA